MDAPNHPTSDPAPHRRGILPSTWLCELAKPGSILLDTARVDAENFRSFLFSDPESILSAGKPEDLASLLSQIERHLAAGRWVAGYVAYEAGHAFEPSVPRRDAGDSPLAWFCVYRDPRIFDHRNARAVANPTAHAAATISAHRRGIAQPDYCRKVDAIRSWIAQGEVYQVNFTDPVGFEYTGSPVDLYLQLRDAQHTSYSAFLNAGAAHILSFSPELFFHIDRQRILTRPMKGTAPRGCSLDQDDAQAAWLAADPKNRAENVMIVDLLRNDLGRICDYGSIRVESLCAVERYDTVLQMTSTVSGTLRQGARLHDVFRALFPSGSVTGAPKIRAMTIIHELEAAPRGVYCGAIGFFSPNGEAAFNVPIRTLVLRGNKGVMGVGSGIVYDSDPEAESRECDLKTQFLSDRPGSFSLIESLLWDGRFPLLPLHLERLRKSALYFAFPFDPDRLQAELQAHAARLNAASQYKVRAVIDSFGALEITSAAIEPDAQPVRVGIAEERVSSRDPFLYHKTTRRTRHQRALAAARERGLDEVLFLNERDEITEGTMHNVFVEIAGALLTPPVSCGLLPGVYREHLLLTDPRCRESVLTLDDLRRADALYLCNAVRCLRPAALQI